MPIDLSEVALDSDLGQCFEIIRTTGQFGLGGWQPQPPKTIRAFGIITIPSPEALHQVPEADRVIGMLQIILAQPIYETLAKNSATSDEIRWNASRYRVQAVEPWEMNGYWSAILTRMRGD